MDANTKWYKLNDRGPGIQLIVSVLIILVLGTILYYLFAIAGTLIFKTGFSGMIAMPDGISDPKQEGILKYNQVAQEITLFIIPGIILAYIFKREKESYLRTNRLPYVSDVFMVVLLSLAMIPVTVYTGILNSKMILPEGLSAVEEWMRTKENIASELTALFIRSSDISELLLNIFILAILPAVAEEIIFRGVLQRLFCNVFRSHHTGIWITAILFSAIHLQFFGFIPRLILGLSFGYLFFWSGNLWLPVTAHFINNFVPVIMSFVMGWTEVKEKTEKLSINQIGIIAASLFICILILYHIRSEYRENLHK